MYRHQLLLLATALIPVALTSASPPVPGRTAGAAPHTPVAIRPGIPPRPSPRYSWPLASPRPVLRPFRPPATRYGPGHRGVDLGGSPGRPVLAAGDGVVDFAGPVVARGVITLRHRGGLRTTYEPVEPAVAVGDSVRRGQVIGHLAAGHPGCPGTDDAAGACLHWGARLGEVYLDPLGLLGLGHVRLLPACPSVSPRRGPPVSRAAAAPPWCAAGTPGTR